MSGSALADGAWEHRSRFGKASADAVPPLMAWLWAVALAAVATAAFFHLASKIALPQSQAFLTFNQQRIEAFAGAHGPGALQVVLLGNSRLKYGTLGEADLAALAADLGHAPMRFLRLVNNWAVFEDFATLESALLAARPDVVVLQMDLLAQERAEPARALLLREYVEWLLVGRGPWNPGNVDQAELQFGTPCTQESGPDALEERRRRVGQWLRIEPDGASARLAQAFVRRAAAAGITVVVLGVPRTSAMDTAMAEADEAFLASADELMSALPQLRALMPAGPPDQLYCDLVHMNEAGRRAFSAQLVGVLASLSPRPRAGP